MAATLSGRGGRRGSAVHTLDRPLRFERRFLQKVWGGRALESALGLALPPDVPIGETWELVDRARENSVVAEGADAGRTLGELMAQDARALLGKAPATDEGRFPVLVKLIDANENLSIQVHPDDATAARLGNGAEGKSEAWIVLDARPGARLYAGLAPDVDRGRFLDALERGAVADLCATFEVRAGDCLLVPGGTVHAIGAGITLLEVQQNSDTTYRIDDWGRVGLDGKPRELHVEQALECIRFGAPVRAPQQPTWLRVSDELERAPLARCRTFGLDALRVRGRTRLATGHQYQVYTVVAGAGALTARTDGVRLPIARCDTLLVPAATGYHDVESDGELLLIRCLHRP